MSCRMPSPGARGDPPWAWSAGQLPRLFAGRRAQRLSSALAAGRRRRRGVGADVGASPMFEDPERSSKPTLWPGRFPRSPHGGSRRCGSPKSSSVQRQRSVSSCVWRRMPRRAHPSGASSVCHRLSRRTCRGFARQAYRALRPRLAGYVHEQLSAAQRDEVEGHLVECPHCQQAVSDLRDLNAGLRTLAPVTGSSIAAPLSAGTSMGATSTGMLSSGLLLKAAAAILVLTPVLVSDRSSGRGDVPATNEENEFVAAQSSPPLEATNTPDLTSSTQPPPATTTATTVSEPSLRRLQPAAITVIAEPTIPLTTDARLWPLPPRRSTGQSITSSTRSPASPHAPPRSSAPSAALSGRSPTSPSALTLPWSKPRFGRSLLLRRWRTPSPSSMWSSPSTSSNRWRRSSAASPT